MHASTFVARHSGLVVTVLNCWPERSGIESRLHINGCNTLEAHLPRFRCTLKKRQVLKIFEVLHYCMPHIRIMVFGHKTSTFFINQPIFATFIVN